MRLWIRSSSRTSPGGTASSCSCSLAHGLSRARADSDLDLAVLLEGAPAGLMDLWALIGDLQALSPDRNVDVALVNRADPLFLKKITENCTLLYGPPRRLHELKMYAFRRYQDHRRYLALERDYVAGALRTATR